jgi:hypothetical protein
VVLARKLKLDPNTLLVQHLRGFDLSHGEVWERLIRDIVRRGPWDLLVLDPIYKMLGSRDENNASDVTEILMSLERAAEGIARIEDGIRNYRATGAMLRMPYFLALKAEALHFADRVSEALEAITEAEAWVERSEERWWCADLHRLRGVFFAAMGTDEAQVEASFYAPIRIAREQRSTSVAARAEASYAEYRFRKGEC